MKSAVPSRTARNFRQTVRILLQSTLVAGLSACVTSSPNDAPKNRPNLIEAAQINTQLGVGYLRAGDLSLAQEKLQRALEQNPDYAGAHSALGLLYERRGDNEAAEREHRRALSLDSENSGLRNNLGVFLCGHGKPEEGLRYLKQAATDLTYSTPEVAWTNAGLCARTIGRDNDAETAFAEALRDNPSFTDALLNMAKLSIDRGDAARARQYLKRYEALAVSTPESLSVGARTEQRLGNTQSARDYETALLQKYPNSEQARQFVQTRQP